MRGLTIKDPWIGQILNGGKIWEIRTQNTNIRERIGLVRSGKSHVAGYATLADCFPMSREELAQHSDKHHIWSEDLKLYGDLDKPLYVWVLTDIEELASPMPFDRPNGAVNWVSIPDPT